MSVLDRFFSPEEGAGVATSATSATEAGASVEECPVSAGGERRHRWLIRHADGWFSHFFMPPVTRARITAIYPEAREIHPEVDPEETSVDSGACQSPARTDPGEASVLVACEACQHFQPSETSPTAGIGRCRVQAPASRRNPALWPSAQRRCHDFRGSQGTG